MRPVIRGMMTRMSRGWIVIALLALGASGCTGESRATASQEKAPAAPQPRPVKVFATVEERVPRTVVATGTLAAEDQVVVGTKVPGRLAEITVDMGTRVRRGQVVARLDASDYRMRVDQADAALQ